MSEHISALTAVESNTDRHISGSSQHEAPLERRLAAILSADAAGYSRLMSEDDIATVRTLTACRKLVGDIINAHRGRIVDTPGDNMLVEFGSAVDAVAAAVQMQAQFRACSAGLPESRRMQFRIGLNLGDIVAQDGRIYGDGVNVAARLEALADHGGICISAKVYDEVHRKLTLTFEDMGEHILKNIAYPIRVFRVLDPNNTVAGAPSQGRAAVAATAHSTKPSIIVLPFANLSGVPDQEYFVDGLTEDILTELSRFHELFVISHNTSMRYKGTAVDVRKIAQELRVQYVLEGSVRRAGSRVRITAQLIDAESDHHVWAERYDRELADIFELQDEMTRAIVAVLPGRVQASAHERAVRKPTANMAAYECVVTAKVRHHRSTREDNAEAQRLIARAIELDPQYAHAHAWRACILGQSWVWGWSKDRDATQAEVERELAIARSLDDNDSDVHRVLAAVAVLHNEFDKAVYHQQRALALNPNDDLIVVQQGEVHTWLGEPDQGIEWILKAMRLNPFHPDRFWSHLARAYFVARRYRDAVEAVQHISAKNEQHYALLAACHAQMDNTSEAGRCMEEARRLVPGFNLREHVLPILHYKQPADLAHHRDALLRAGLPE